MPRLKMPYLFTVVVTLLFFSCDNDKCPEGSIPILDPNGDLIDCTQTFDSQELSKINDIELQTEP